MRCSLHSLPCPSAVVVAPALSRAARSLQPPLLCALIPVRGFWGYTCTHLWVLSSQCRAGPGPLHSVGGSLVPPVPSGWISLPRQVRPAGTEVAGSSIPWGQPVCHLQESGAGGPGAWGAWRRAGSDGGGPRIGPQLQGHCSVPWGKRGQQHSLQLSLVF